MLVTVPSLGENRRKGVATPSSCQQPQDQHTTHFHMLTIIFASRLSFNTSSLEALVQSGQRAFSTSTGGDGHYFLRCTQPGAISTQIHISVSKTVPRNVSSALPCLHGYSQEATKASSSQRRHPTIRLLQLCLFESLPPCRRSRCSL